MTTDLEHWLAARLRREAGELVPGSTAPRPLPARPASPAARWRIPAVAAASVLVAAIGITVAVQSNRAGSSVPAIAPGQSSPVLDSPAPAFQCIGTAKARNGMTTSTARIGQFRIGITADAFCVTTYHGSGTAGSSLQPSGALRSWVSSESGVAGVVEPSVDRVAWVPNDADEKPAATVDLYSLGPLNGFAFPIASGGTLLLYSRSSEVARKQIPYPGEGSPAVTSSASAQPTTRGARRSYPPGQSGPSKADAWPTNARGESYGIAGGDNGEPDLVAAVATNGKTGYLRRTDLELPPPANPSEAAARNTMPARTIPVFQSDGLTQIGVFVIDGAG